MSVTLSSEPVIKKAFQRDFSRGVRWLMVLAGLAAGLAISAVAGAQVPPVDRVYPALLLLSLTVGIASGWSP